jgi:hypothetical protein
VTDWPAQRMEIYQASPPSILQIIEGDRVLLTIKNDGTVTGEIADMEGAAKIFCENIQARMTAWVQDQLGGVPMNKADTTELADAPCVICGRGPREHDMGTGLATCRGIAIPTYRPALQQPPSPPPAPTSPQEDRSRAPVAASHEREHNSELEPDDQGQRDRSPDRQGREGEGLGRRPAVLSGGVQRGERAVRGEDCDKAVNDGAGGSDGSPATAPTSPASVEGAPVAWRTEYRDVYKGRDTGWHYCYHTTEPNPAPPHKDFDGNLVGHRNKTPLYAHPTSPTVEEVDGWEDGMDPNGEARK